jgi:hypothetical protein
MPLGSFVWETLIEEIKFIIAMYLLTIYIVISPKFYVC